MIRRTLKRQPKPLRRGYLARPRMLRASSRQACITFGALLIVLTTVTFTGCTRRGPVTPTLRPAPTRVTPAETRDTRRHMLLPTVASINREPVVRVRIQKNAARVEVSTGQSLLIGPATAGDGAGTTRRFTRAVAVTYYRGAFLVTDTRGQTVRWALRSMRLTPGTSAGAASGAPFAFNGKPYPGSLVLVPVKDENGRPTGRIDVVNHVAMESYLPGVIERELYGSWDPTAFRAAAIAARTYAVFESSLNSQKHYDIESTTASQVYGGRSANPKVLQAVEQTRGLLIAYHGRIVPAFYSSSCGGTSQDAKAAFTWLPGLPNMPPLRGKSRGPWCQSSDKFRWGPVARAKAPLALRFKAWGNTQDHPIKSLRGIRDIRVARTNSAGRPTAFSIADHAGMTFTLGAEQFRQAGNHPAPGLGKPGKGRTLYSSHVSVKVSASAVTFYDGRGFGHGVGLCQFGTQGLAKAGYSEYSILAYYYPGSKVLRAYP